MKYLKLIFSILIFGTSAFLCVHIVTKSVANQRDKIDLSELNHIKYGLFSVTSWKEKLQVVIADEINNLSFSKADGAAVREQIQNQLRALIDKVYERIRDSNRSTISGGIKQSIIERFVDVDDIKKGVPEYTDTIIRELSKAQNEQKIKGILKERVRKYFDRTFEAKDLSLINEIVQRTGASDPDEAKKILQEQVKGNQAQIYLQTWALISLSGILFLILGFSKVPLSRMNLTLLIATLLLLLLAGVSTPMIDMEAKIAQLSFVLLDHPIAFADQILYFQSKSILDVFIIMIVHPDIQMKVVGILLVSFSIIFPLVKILASLIYYSNYQNWRSSRIVQFFVLKSGKWSMTDVLVVAIFMAYIGFNGVISSQLEKLTAQNEDVMMLVTNGTSLQPGFYLFFAYAVLALFFTGVLTKNQKDNI